MPATWCCGCSPTARSTRAPSRSSSPTRPTAPSRTGWRGRSGRSVRPTRRSSTATRRSPPSSRDRLDLALGAVERQVLDRYGEWLDIDGVAVPAWLIVDGADATGEALLGLAPYVAATADRRAERVLQRLGEGVAAMQSGDARTWPFGAVLPWARSQAVWHAWGGLAPAGLARAYEVTGDRDMRRAALSDAAAFTPHLLIAAGPRERVAALADRARPDRLRRPFPCRVVAVGGRSRRPPRPPPCRRHRRGVVLRQQPGRRGDV